jgi:hypothetical protein
MRNWRRYANLLSIVPLGLSPADLLTYLPSRQELRHQYRIISELRAEIKTLQTDNLKLYEKVRYMQSYRHDMAVQPGQGTNGSAVLTDIISGSVTKDPYNGGSGPRPRDGDLAKYRDKYEQSMNPFEAFRGRVSRMSGYPRHHADIPTHLRVSVTGSPTSRTSFESSGKSSICPDTESCGRQEGSQCVHTVHRRAGESVRTEKPRSEWQILIIRLAYSTPF